MTIKINKTGNQRPVQPISSGYHTVTPWLIVKGAAQLITFLKAAFAAEETEGSRFYNEDGTIGQAEVRIGDSVVMMFDAGFSDRSTKAVDDNADLFAKLMTEVLQCPKLVSAGGADAASRARSRPCGRWSTCSSTRCKSSRAALT